MKVPKIMVVDDSATMRRLLIRALVIAGVDKSDIVQAVDGQDALDKISHSFPDVLITDITMPNMTGDELLRSLQERGWTDRLQIAVCTSIRHTRTLLDLVRVGASVVIRKPFSPSEVVQNLQPLLEKAALMEELPERVNPDVEAESVEEPISCQVSEITPETLQSLDAAIASVLEGMAFMDVAVVESEIDDTHILVSSELDIKGPCGVKLMLFGSTSLCGNLLEQLLGEADPDNDLAKMDALNEVLNIVAGEFLEERKRAGEPGAADLVLDLPTADVHRPGGVLEPMSRAYQLDDSEHVLFAQLIPVVQDLQTEAA